MTTRYSLPAFALALALALFSSVPATFAQTSAFSEDFGDLPQGTIITTVNTKFTFIRTAGAFPYTGALTAGNPSSFGTRSSLSLLSSGYASSPNLTGVGVDGLETSDVWSLSVNIGAATWTSGSYAMILMGHSTGAQQVYNPNGMLTTAGVTDETIGEQSLFVLRIFGSTALNGGCLQTIAGDGVVMKIQNANSDVVLANGRHYQLHLVANGSPSVLNVGEETILPGTMSIYIDGVYVASAPIAAKADATSLRILAAGNSSAAADSNQLSMEVDDLHLWVGAVAPVAPASPRP